MNNFSTSLANIISELDSVKQMSTKSSARNAAQLSAFLHSLEKQINVTLGTQQAEIETLKTNLVSSTISVKPQI